LAVKKILLALDSSAHSRRAAEYLAEVAGHLPGCEVLLLTVISRWPVTVAEPVTDEPLPVQGEVHGDEDIQKALAEAQEFMREISELLLQSGFAETRLQRLLIPQEHGVAQDIIAMAEGTGCDTIVVGRRNLSKVQSIFLGSVSADLVKQAVGRTVWVVE
jgi:nucleotide-binding universal stress UspA family protein